MTNDPKFIPGTAIRKESKPLPGKPWEDDALGSKKVAEKLTNAVEDAARVDVDNAYVIGFHGEWGTGKTFVLERWCEELKLKKNPPCVVVYYNAWEDDFLASPLVAIVARLKETMSGIKEFRSTMGKFVPMLNAADKIVRACFGNVDVVKIIEVVKIILEAKGDVDKSGDTDEVNRYLDLRKETDALKENLRGIAEIVKKKTNFPLVFVIDELDRCRPVFALEILERVKHLFNVPDVVFVLGMNKAGLEKSIGKVYGYDDTQSEKYLRRFFDREVSMPLPSPENYCYHLLHKYGVIKCFGRNASFIGKVDTDRFLVPMIGFWGLSLREVESLVRLLLDVINKERRIESVRSNWALLTLCLMLIKVKKPALYIRLVAGQFNCKDLVDEVMKMFCDEKSTNLQFRNEFGYCQRVMEGEVYRFASVSDWDNISKQMKSILYDRESPPARLALAKYTLDLGKRQVENLYRYHARGSKESEKERVSVKDITSLIELNDVE